MTCNNTVKNTTTLLFKAAAMSSQSASVAATPGWLAELSEAWIEPPPGETGQLEQRESDESISSSPRSSGSVVVAHTSVLDFGSIVVRDSAMNCKGQLAHAIAAIDRQQSGLVTSMTPKAPTNRLAMLFMRGNEQPKHQQREEQIHAKNDTQDEGKDDPEPRPPTSEEGDQKEGQEGVSILKPDQC